MLDSLHVCHGFNQELPAYMYHDLGRDDMWINIQ